MKKMLVGKTKGKKAKASVTVEKNDKKRRNGNIPQKEFQKKMTPTRTR